MSGAPSPGPDAVALRRAYDGSRISFRALRACGWGPLVNLGYYELLQLPLLLLGSPPFQRRLARKAIDLLELQPGHRVLDAGCGWGWTTAEMGRRGASALGLDLLPEHIERARHLFGERPEVAFEAGDATRLPPSADDFELGEASVDRVHCLEAAFQFGAEGRLAFLGECFRVLRPGGRLVLVDFVWNDAHPERIAEVDIGAVVRDTWQFEQFEPLESYRTRARELGFREHALLDWSKQVTLRYVQVCAAFAWAGHHAPTRTILNLRFPELREFDRDDWEALMEVVRAHERVRSHSGYMALVFEKPNVTPG